MNSGTKSTDPVPAGTRSTDSRATESEALACFNCGCTQYAELFRARDFDTALNSFPIRCCRQCELNYTGEVDDNLLAAIYSSSYYGSEKAKFLSVIETLIKIGHHRQAKKILALYRGQQPGQITTDQAVSVLDIGCGRALLLQEFDKLGADCLGIERSEFPRKELDRINIHIGALHDSELTDEHFDIIILWHVLEHITRLGSLIKELPGHLNPDGLLVISVPNFSSWQSRFFKQHWFHLDIPRHVTHLDIKWLERTLGAMGLKIISRNTFTVSQNIYGFIQSSLNKLFPQKPNRLYKLLTQGQGQGRQDWLSLLAWSLLAVPFVPLAILESLITERSHQGATLTIYARNHGHASKATAEITGE